jgi:hypothetical protein
MDLSPDQIQQMINMLQTMLDNTAENTTHKIKPTIKTKKSSSKKHKYVNKFVDMPEHSMHKEDIEIDKKLHNRPLVPRNRTNPLIAVQCRVCGKKDQINASIVGDRDRYKCNKCSVSAG